MGGLPFQQIRWRSFGLVDIQGEGESTVSLGFTERAKRALVLAEEEAQNEKADYIAIEHLVKAVLRVQAEKDLETK